MEEPIGMLDEHMTRHRDKRIRTELGMSTMGRAECWGVLA